jgi:hypothetical protein
MISTMTYAEIYELHVLMLGGVWVRKSRYGDMITLDVFVSSLLFFSSLDLGPVQMASARVFTTFGVSQVEVHWRDVPDPPKCCPEWYRSVAALTISYQYVRGMNVQSFLLFSFFFSCTVYAAQEVCTSRRGIM